MRNVSDLQGENEWQRKKSGQENIQHFPQVLRCSRAKQRQRNVQKIVLHVHAKYEKVTWERDVPLLQTLSLLFQLVQFVKCWQFLLKFTLKDCFEIQGEKKSYVVFTPSTLKIWN